MTIPVSESSDERNLRRLVDAINANAETSNANANANTSTTKNGDSGGAKSSASNDSSSSSSRSSRALTNSSSSSSSKSPPKKGSRKHEDPAPVRGVQRTPPRKGQQSYFSPKSGRSRARARTNDDTAPGRPRNDLSPAPEQNHLPRRARWTGSGGREKDKRLSPSKGQGEGEEPGRRVNLDSHLESAYTAAAAKVTAAEMRGLRGQAGDEEEGVGDRVGRGVPWGAEGTPTRKKRGEHESAGVRVGLGASGERGAATLGGGGGSIDAQPGYRAEEEDSLPIEDRLQAVMKDLGVPSAEHG